MNGFSADPEALVGKGNRINELYNGCIAQKQKVANTSDSIVSAWNDQTCRTFVNTIHSYDDDFEQLYSIVEQLGQILVRHGNRLMSTRDELTDIAGRL